MLENERVIMKKIEAKYEEGRALESYFRVWPSNDLKETIDNVWDGMYLWQKALKMERSYQNE